MLHQKYQTVLHMLVYVSVSTRLKYSGWFSWREGNNYAGKTALTTGKTSVVYLLEKVGKTTKLVNEF